MQERDHRLVFEPDDDRFWETFAERYWERAPVALTVPEPLFGSDEVFAAVTGLSGHGRYDRFWLATSSVPRTRAEFQLLDLDLLGPRPSDGGFDGFFARMAGHRFGVNIHRLVAGNPELAGRVERFIRHLGQVPGGPPPLSWHCDAFFGTYRATPFGIHRDQAGVFSFVLSGRRTYCTWAPDCFAEGDAALRCPDPDVIAAELDRAECFEAGPGDCVYWPSGRWHVVLSDDEPFVTAQVFAQFDRAAAVGR